MLRLVHCICLLNDKKKTLKKFGPRTWCTKKPFGYRVIHQNSLTSCPGLTSFLQSKQSLLEHITVI